MDSGGVVVGNVVKFLTLGMLMQGFKCLMSHKAGTPQGVSIYDIHSYFFHKHSR